MLWPIIIQVICYCLRSIKSNDKPYIFLNNNASRAWRPRLQKNNLQSQVLKLHNQDHSKQTETKKGIPQGRDQFRHFAMNFTRCTIIMTIPLIFTKVNLANISGFSTIPYTIKDFQNTWKYLSFNIFFYILNCIHLCFKRRYANKPLQKQSCGVLISWSYFTNYEFDECWIENSDSFI